MNERIHRDPAVISRIVENSVVVYDPRSDTVHTLNATARTIWECCDGRAEHEIIDRIAGTYDTLESNAAVDVRRALRQFSDLNLITGEEPE